MGKNRGKGLTNNHVWNLRSCNVCTHFSCLRGKKEKVLHRPSERGEEEKKEEKKKNRGEEAFIHLWRYQALEKRIHPRKKKKKKH